MKLSLTKKDFKNFKTFERAVQRVFGEETYVGTEYCVVRIEYSKTVREMLRPYPEKELEQFELDLDNNVLTLK